MTRTWLCPDASDRARLLDMDRRLRPVRSASFAILAVGLVLVSPSFGLEALGLLALVTVGFVAMSHRLEEARRPEYRVAAAWLFSQLAVAVAVVITGGPLSPGVAWLAVPLVTLPARFSSRGVWAGVLVTGILLTAATLGADPQAVVDEPARLVLPLALVFAVALLSTALMQSDREHRSEAVVDALTGMLNRNALATRTTELAEQARAHEQTVALVVGDIDHFKAINDGHGHGVGDAVLAGVAERIRSRLRAFDLAYRIGGEEFLVVLPGSSIEDAERIAEGLRVAIADQPIAGLHVTMSFGVAVSDTGDFDYQAVFAAADLAMYEAKHHGRNRVRSGSVREEVAA